MSTPSNYTRDPLGLVLAALRRIPALCLPALLALAVACSSTGGGPLDAVGRPARIRFVSGSSVQAFELVNETHTGRVELYSTTRSQADTKVQTDEVVDEILEHFERLGLFERAQAGALPATNSGHTSTVEIDVAGAPLHFGVGPGSPVEDRTLFNQCFQTFLLVYNQTYQLQSVKRHPGWSPTVQKPR